MRDVLSVPLFVAGVKVSFFVARVEFQVGVLRLRLQRSFGFGEDLEPLVVLVCYLHWKLCSRRLCPLFPSAGYAGYSYQNTVLPRIIAGGDYFFVCIKRGRLFEGGNYFKYFSLEVVP